MIKVYIVYYGNEDISMDVKGVFLDENKAQALHIKLHDEIKDGHPFTQGLCTTMEEYIINE